MKKNNPELIQRRSQFIPERGWDIAINAIAGIMAIALYVVAALDAVRFGWLLVSIELKALGFIGIILSMIMLFFVMKENPFLFRIVKVQKGQTVVTTGPYSIVRHPMYIAVIIQFSAIPLALGSLYALIPAMIMNILIVIRTYLEDKTLHKELKGYKAYAKKTPYKLLPFIW